MSDQCHQMHNDIFYPTPLKIIFLFWYCSELGITWFSSNLKSLADQTLRFFWVVAAMYLPFSKEKIKIKVGVGCVVDILTAWVDCYLIDLPTSLLWKVHNLFSLLVPNSQVLICSTSQKFCSVVVVTNALLFRILRWIEIGLERVKMEKTDHNNN